MSVFIVNQARRLPRPPALLNTSLSTIFPLRSQDRQSTRPASSNSSTHTSLPTFLNHARRTGLSRTSTVYAGTLYEYTCQSALARLGFSLTRVGGRGDAGVDLSGTWALPGSKPTFPTSLDSGSSTGSTENPERDAEVNSRISTVNAVVQCKALKLKAGPVLVRELEGALALARAKLGTGAGREAVRGTVGVLCAMAPATKGVRDALRNSGAPLVWVQVEQVVGSVEESGRHDGDAEGDEDVDGESVGTNSDSNVGVGVVKQMLWNEAVERIGARGLDVTVSRTGKGLGGEEIKLLWEGEIWKPDV